MKFNFWKKSAAGVLAALVCLSAAGTTAMAADTAAQPGGTPPSGTSQGTPPDMPSGGTPPSGSSQGTPPDMPSGGTPPSGSSQGTPPSGGGADTMTYDYSGTLSGALTADGKEVSSDGETYAADTADENAALAENGGTLTIRKSTLTKSGDDTNGDNCNFYGINSILLAAGDGSQAYISDSKLSASSQGSNGIFATDGGTIYASGDTISTTADNSRGLDATYGGTIVADGMTLATQGDHCAAIATDRGGGSISVTNSSLSTAGSGSPLLYSTGDIEVDGVTGTASGSQLAGMEGLNTILIYNSNLESTVTSASASDPIADGVILYQSTSGDAESATGESAMFQAVNSTLKSAIQSGAMFYVTNTTANIVLSGTTLDFDADKANLLTIAGNDANSWGTAGSNGGTVTFTALGETLSGSIDVDTISSLDLFLLSGTTYTGAMAISENAVNTSASQSPITVNLSADSTWVVTGDSTVTNLNAADGAKIVDADGKTVTVVAGGKTVVSGNSACTVTVTGSYSNTVTTSDANALSTSFIDRSGFDSYYAVSTTFGANGSADSAAASADASAAASSASTAVVTDPTASPTGLSAVLAVAVCGVGIWAVQRGKRKKGGE
jgi:hypothetical protein